MGIFSSINSGIEYLTRKASELVGLSGDENTSTRRTKHPNSVTGNDAACLPNVDAFVHRTPVDKKPITPENLERLCKERNINGQELMNNLSEIFGISMAELDRNPREKAIIMRMVERSVKKADYIASHTNKQVDYSRIILVDAKIAYDAIHSGAFKDEEQLDKKVEQYNIRTISDELIKDENKLTDDEYSRRIRNVQQIRQNKKA